MRDSGRIHPSESPERPYILSSDQSTNLNGNCTEPSTNYKAFEHLSTRINKAVLTRRYYVKRKGKRAFFRALSQGRDPFYSSISRIKQFYPAKGCTAYDTIQVLLRIMDGMRRRIGLPSNCTFRKGARPACRTSRGGGQARPSSAPSRDTLRDRTSRPAPP